MNCASDRVSLLEKLAIYKVNVSLGHALPASEVIGVGGVDRQYNLPYNSEQVPTFVVILFSCGVICSMIVTYYLFGIASSSNFDSSPNYR